MGKTEPSGGYLSKEDQQFREEMRTFFQENIPAEIRAKVSAGQPLAKQDFVTSQRILNAHGLAVPNWPLEWGGRDWTPVQRYLFIEELQFNARAAALAVQLFHGRAGDRRLRQSGAEGEIPGTHRQSR